MNTEQALHIMEQAVQLAIKGCASLNDVRAIIAAWDTVKPLINDKSHEVPTFPLGPDRMEVKAEDVT